jgi:glycosyltransferase involved in cell wall biosynthesis
MMEKKILNIVAYAYVGKGISGGDRIFIECVKRWSGKDYTINVFTSKVGLELCKRYGLGLKNVTYIVLSPSKLEKSNLYLAYVIRLIKGSIIITRFLEKIKDTKIVVYSESDFWPDSIPAWVLKMRFRRAKWIAAFYLFTSSPFSKGSLSKGFGRLRRLFYYLSQVPVYGLIRKYADMVWVTNELDRWRFIDGRRLTADKVIAIKGGVDVRTPSLVPEPMEKKFDTIFIGRLVPEKGVLELIDIWKYVCEKKKDAKLAILGSGPLNSQVQNKIRQYGLTDNIKTFGFVDGVEKFKIIKESKVVVHPSIIDSGGMAACEAMICGLPGVSFDLQSLKVYYPKGMLKTPSYDLKIFANNVLKLLDDESLYRNLSKEAIDFAKDWDWDKVAKEALNKVKKVCLTNRD